MLDDCVRPSQKAGLPEIDIVEEEIRCDQRNTVIVKPENFVERRLSYGSGFDVPIFADTARFDSNNWKAGCQIIFEGVALSLRQLSREVEDLYVKRTVVRSESVNESFETGHLILMELSGLPKHFISIILPEMPLEVSIRLTRPPVVTMPRVCFPVLRQMASGPNLSSSLASSSRRISTSPFSKNFHIFKLLRIAVIIDV